MLIGGEITGRYKLWASVRFAGRHYMWSVMRSQAATNVRFAGSHYMWSVMRSQAGTNYEPVSGLLDVITCDLWWDHRRVQTVSQCQVCWTSLRVICDLSFMCLRLWVTLILFTLCALRLQFILYVCVHILLLAATAYTLSGKSDPLIAW